MAVSGVNHVTLCVSDLDRSIDFYCEVLGFHLAARWAKGAYLEAGSIWLAFILKPGYRRSENEDYSHIAFTCSEADFVKLNAKLLDAGAKQWSSNISEGDSYYFCDPDGHQLEIHVGDLDTRLSYMRKNPSREIEFFDRAKTSSGS